MSSGLRIGTPALATRGLQVEDFVEVGSIIAEALVAEDFEQRQPEFVERTTAIADRYPLYPRLGAAAVLNGSGRGERDSPAGHGCPTARPHGCRRRRPINPYSNAATVARITNVAISAVPSNTVASPSPVICHTITAVPMSDPMYTGASVKVSLVAVSNETITSSG